MADTNFKFCTACGRKVALNAQFCGGCGAALGAKEKSVQAPTQKASAATPVTKGTAPAKKADAAALSDMFAIAVGAQARGANQPLSYSGRLICPTCRKDVTDFWHTVAVKLLGDILDEGEFVDQIMLSNFMCPKCGNNIPLSDDSIRRLKSLYCK